MWWLMGDAIRRQIFFYKYTKLVGIFFLFHTFFSQWQWRISVKWQYDSSGIAHLAKSFHDFFVRFHSRALESSRAYWQRRSTRFHKNKSSGAKFQDLVLLISWGNAIWISLFDELSGEKIIITTILSSNPKNKKQNRKYSI